MLALVFRRGTVVVPCGVVWCRRNAHPEQSGHGHSEAFGVISRAVFPDVTLPRLAKVHAPDTVESSSSASSTSTPAAAAAGAIVTAAGNGTGSDGTPSSSNAMDAEKEEAAAEAELLDTLVGLVALKGGGGTGGSGAPQSGGGGGGEGLGAEGGSLGNGRYAVRMSEGRESSGRVEESTLLNLLFVPDGR